MKMFAIRDVKGESYGVPMAFINRGIATRVFYEMCQDARGDYSKYPTDFMLYEIGTWEPNTGVLGALPVPEFVASATEMVQAARSAKVSSEPNLPGVPA